MTDRLAAERSNMGIAGLCTYSSTGFYYAMNNRSKTGTANKESDFGILQEKDNEKTQSSPTTNSSALEPVQGTYSRCISANIRTEELFASRSAEGELVYSYKASEQSFRIWINSDGENKTYSIEGIDKDGQEFTKEFDPYDVVPEYSDFPEFAALCMYIRNTDETADL